VKDEIQSILDSPKSLPFLPSWKREEGNEFLTIVSPIDVDGITLEGWRFRVTAHAPSADMQVSFQLEALFPRIRNKFLPIVRFEWLPRSPHSNKGKGPVEWRYISIDGSHLHPHALNWVGDAPLTGNLPLAIPIGTNLPTFQSALEYVEEEFRIGNVKRLQVPPWEATQLL
jgi:hypothetical protein